MSQDIISDALNKIMNAKKTNKEKVVITKYSKLLIKVLDIAKSFEYVSNYKVDGRNIEINFGQELHECKTIKPRYTVDQYSIEKYMKRYLPSIDLGIIIISTPKGLMTHREAIENKIGGVLIAYFY